jgi:hypothetical protein
MMTDKDILYAYGHGTTDLNRNVIVMQSKDFVVIRTPGHSDWSGVGSRDYYPSYTVLLHKGEWCMSDDREEWYGRVSKKVVKERLVAAQIRGRVEPKIHQDKDSTRL